MNRTHPHPPVSVRLRRTPAAAIALLAAALAGCASLLGSSAEALTIFAPEPTLRPDPAWPAADWQLTIARTDAPRMIDTLRIAVRPTPGQIQVYKGANWAQLPSMQIEDVVLRTLENSGKIVGVAPQGSGISADYRLVMDLRRFDADYAGAATPSAVIEVNAKLLRALNQEVIGSHTFSQSVPADGVEVAQVNQAFSRGLGEIGHAIAGWVLSTGQTAQRRRPANAPARPQ